MQKELKYLILNYTDKDLEYIDILIEKLDKITEEIVDFFNIDSFEKKISVKLNDSLDTFYKKYIKTGYSLEQDGTVPKWVCGFVYRDTVETLCLSEYRKTKSHENHNLDDLLYLILHEFTHSCHFKLNPNRTLKYKWLSEGLATTISHQYDNAKDLFDATLEQMTDGDYTDYRNYHTMFKYVLDTYGREYILKLIKNSDLLFNETPKLYNEVKEKFNN